MGSSPWGSGQSIWGNARQWEVTWICELVSYSLNFNTGEFIRLLQRTKEATLLKVFIDIQSSDHVRPFVTPWTAAYQASLPFTISWSLLKFMSNESIMPPNHLSSVHPASLAFNLSQHQGPFQWLGSLHHVAKVLELHHQSFQWIFWLNFL